MSKRMGRPSIFSGKDLTRRLQGAAITPDGRKHFEAARRRLGKIASEFKACGRTWKVSEVSDGDVIEYLSRGHEATVAYLMKKIAL